MNFATKLSNPPSEQVLRQAESVIQAWALRCRVSETVVCRLVRCLDSKFLLSLPRPAGFKVGKFSAPQIHRYLWYRQAAKALGWRDRQKFPAEIESLLKLLVWPDGEAEICDVSSAITCQRPSQTTNTGGISDAAGHWTVGHVSRDAGQRGHAMDTHNTFGAGKGSSGEEHRRIVRPSPTVDAKPSYSGVFPGSIASAGSDAGDPFIDDTCSITGKRPRPSETTHRAQSDAAGSGIRPGSDDRDNAGSDGKRPRLPRFLCGDSN